MTTLVGNSLRISGLAGALIIGLAGCAGSTIDPLDGVRGPVISSFAPSRGVPGTVVTIEGAGLSSSLELDVVKFNGTLASASFFSPTRIQVAVPSAATTGRITVTVAGATAASATDFVVTSSSPTGPTIVTQPEDLSVTEGSSATFSVTASGEAPLTYQWTFEGTSLPGATSASYTVAQARPATAGRYAVKVSNGSGSTTSRGATLTVIAAGGGGGGAGGRGGGSGGSGGGTGGSGGGTGGSGGSCDQGATTTTWASNCGASATSCTSGTWVAGGPDPDHSGFKLLAETTHFAIYSDESASNAKSAADYLETVWNTYFGSPIYMKEPLCNSGTKYKASVHVHSDWGLTGGSWASGRMGMWIGTGGLSDHWGLAHEFMHGVQSVEGGMSCNQSNTCGWVYESDANWHAQQMAEYHASEVHCSEMLANAPHLYLGSTRDRYCNWQFLEFLKDKYCFSAANAIWTGTPTADPFQAIMKAMSWNISQLNDFFGEWAMHNVTWDYQDPQPQSTAGKSQGSLYRSKYGLITDTSTTERRLRLTKLESLDSSWATNRRFVSPYYWAPQRWGYNVVRLYPEAGTTAVTVTFRGVIQSGANSDFRWGLVATDSGMTTPRYSALQRGTDGQLTFCVKSGESLFLVVMGTPSVKQQIVWDQAYSSIYRYPYMVQLTNAWPEGFQGGTQAACPSGTTRIPNGGGCGPSSLPSSVYVGPYARVLGGSVSGSARIEDHATVVNGTVTSGTIGAMSLIGSSGGWSGNSFNVSTSGKILTTFYPLGFFESGQGLSGSASLIGDVEYRGQGYSRSSGTCSGFVDSSTCVSESEVTLAPPYSWR